MPLARFGHGRFAEPGHLRLPRPAGYLDAHQWAGFVIISRPANGPYHPSRMNYAGTRPIEIKPPVVVFTTTAVPEGNWPRSWPRS